MEEYLVDPLFDTLCGLLDEEIERQGNVMAVCTAQRNAIFARDLDGIAARTAALELLIRESLAAQTKRHETLKPIVEHFGLAPDRQTMTELIGVAPEPWKSRLSELQLRLRCTIDETRKAVRANAKATRRSKRIADELLGVLRQDHQVGRNGYGSRGGESPHRTSVPVLIDRRG